MRNRMVVVIFAFLLCLAPAYLFALEGHGDGEAMEMPPAAPDTGMAAPAESPAKDIAAPSGEAEIPIASAVEVGNKICPVSGEKVDDHGKPYKIEYMGKIYNLCCSMCEKDFKKDSAKYISKIEEEMKGGMETDDDAGKAGGVY